MWHHRTDGAVEYWALRWARLLDEKDGKERIFREGRESRETKRMQRVERDTEKLWRL